eukprot:scaffold273_cov31-Phaeocystis_antarctica.AAC.1
MAAAWTARLPFLVEPSGTRAIWAAGVRRHGALECYCILITRVAHPRARGDTFGEEGSGA